MVFNFGAIAYCIIISKTVSMLPKKQLSKFNCFLYNAYSKSYEFRSGVQEWWRVWQGRKDVKAVWYSGTTWYTAQSRVDTHISDGYSRGKLILVLVMCCLSLDIGRHLSRIIILGICQTFIMVMPIGTERHEVRSV